MSENIKLEKNERIKQEIARLNGLLENIDDKKKNAVISLIKNAAFMSVTLEDLQKEINEKGVTEKYKNGANQFGVKKSSAVEVYNTMIKNHVQVVKQLTDLLPKEVTDGKEGNDGFDAFVADR